MKTRRPLPWKPIHEMPRFYFPEFAAHPRFIVATGHPIGFGTAARQHGDQGLRGWLPDWSYGDPKYFLDLGSVPKSFWRKGSTMPAPTRSGYHTSRFAIGVCDTWINLGREKVAHAFPLLSIHTGTTIRTPKVWTSAGRYHGHNKPSRWVSYADLWATLPAEVRAANAYRFKRDTAHRSGSYEKVQPSSRSAAA